MTPEPVPAELLIDRLGKRIAQMTVDHEVLALQYEAVTAERDATRLELEQLQSASRAGPS